MKTKRYMLVYQGGIANVFEVSAFVMEDKRRNAKRVLQHTFEVCRYFAAGAGCAGAMVRTAYCNEAGDIAKSTWNEDRDAAPFSEKAIPVRAN